MLSPFRNECYPMVPVRLLKLPQYLSGKVVAKMDSAISVVVPCSTLRVESSSTNHNDRLLVSSPSLSTIFIIRVTPTAQTTRSYESHSSVMELSPDEILRLPRDVALPLLARMADELRALRHTVRHICLFIMPSQVLGRCSHCWCPCRM